jgi:hypothetical protein
MNETIAKQDGAASRVTVRLLGKFLRGDRGAILAIASSRGALGLSLLFVVSAGLAREYDNHDLSSEPWRLFLPAAVSLGTSFILFSLLYVVARSGASGPAPFLRLYPRFLTLYWMTAPLAWFYAIPVERFLSEWGAFMANLALLTLVSVWRVFLMVRLASVICDVPGRAAVGPVMLFADVVALAAITVAPKPVFMAMAGIWSSRSQLAGGVIGLWIGLAGVITLPVWLISTGVDVVRERPWRFALPDCVAAMKVARGAWALALAALVGLTPALPWTQAEQRLRSEVEMLLYSEWIDEAVALMATHRRSDFPPQWDPPPHPHDAAPRLLDVTDAVLDAQAPPWVLALFSWKMRGLLHDSSLVGPESLSDEQFERYVRVLLAAPDGAELVWEKRSWLSTRWPGCSDRRRKLNDQIWKLAEDYGRAHGKQDPGL